MDSYGATGGLLESTPLICGGITNGVTSDACYTLDRDKARNLTKMLVKRAHSTSIILDSKHLWVTGGLDLGTELVHSSSELVNVEYTSLGPELPRALYMHALVSVQEDETMVVGGVNSNGTTADSDLTHIYNHRMKRWTNGPILNTGRHSHAAFIVIDLVTEERLVIAAGGYLNEFSINSTEILIDNRWVEGTTKFMIFPLSISILMNLRRCLIR